MSELLRTINPDLVLPPTHVVSQPVAAFRIIAADEIAMHQRVTVLADGEPAYVQVPDDFCHLSTPVTGDWLLISRDGAISHQRDDLFRADSRPVPRADAGCLSGPPRVPRFPG